MSCVICQKIAKSREKALRLPEYHQRRINFEGVCKLRLKRRYTRSEAENLSKKLGENHRVPFEIFTVKPWEKDFGKVSVFPVLSSVLGRDNN